MQTVVDSDVQLAAISDENQLPGNMLRQDKAFATEHNAMKISDELHDLLIDEALRRTAFDHVEYFDVTAFDHVEYFDAPDGSDDEEDSDEDDGDG